MMENRDEARLAQEYGDVEQMLNALDAGMPVPAVEAAEGSAPQGHMFPRMDAVEPRWPEFLWRPYLRAGNVNMIHGNGSTGKTSLVMALMEAVTRGKRPVGMPGELCLDRPRGVVYLGAEDEMEVYAAMMESQGVDRSRVVIPSGKRAVRSLDETEALRAYLRDADAALLIVDPIQAYMPSGADMNKAGDVRNALDALRALCREERCCAVLLGHWNKNVKESAMYRGSGSMDFVNGSRSVLTTGWTAEGKRAAAHVKSNGAPLGDAILFDIVRAGQGWRLIWQGSSASIGADDLFGTPPAGGGAALAGDMYKALIRAIAQDKKQWSGRGYEALSLARGYGLDADIMTEAGFGRAMHEGMPGVQCSFKRVKAGFRYSIILQEEAYEQQVAPGV